MLMEELTDGKKGIKANGFYSKVEAFGKGNPIMNPIGRAMSNYAENLWRINGGQE